MHPEGGRHLIHYFHLRRIVLIVLCWGASYLHVCHRRSHRPPGTPPLAPLLRPPTTLHPVIMHQSTPFPPRLALLPLWRSWVPRPVPVQACTPASEARPVLISSSLPCYSLELSASKGECGTRGPTEEAFSLLLLAQNAVRCPLLMGLILAQMGILEIWVLESNAKTIRPSIHP